jgi:hypothetical protein
MYHVKVIFALMCSFYISVRATSDADPSLVYLCDAMSPLFGCDPQFWKGGDRLQCLNKTQVMNWASSPVRTDCFEITAGDEENPSKSYVPGELVTINVRVSCFKMWYRGIMLVKILSYIV